jgi:cobalt-zinc-cadmium efflux system protein
MAHTHDPVSHNRAFALGVALNVGFVVVELVFGIIVGSLALVADAWHNLSDVLGLLLAWAASFLAARRPTQRRTYGFKRTTILASLVSALLLMIALGAIIWEALGRLGDPAPVSGATMMVVAGVGVVVNAVTAALFYRDRKSDLNIRGAFLHMAADAGISLGVVVAGLVIMGTGWSWIDPLLSLVISAIILVATWGLLRESLDLVFDAVPRGIDPEAVQRFLADLPGVSEIHDLHIWAMSTTETALTAHLVMPRGPCDAAFLSQVAQELESRFGIGHTTIQIESGEADVPCEQAAPDRV